MDLFFFVGKGLLSDDSPIEHFHHATQIVLTLENEKNVIRGESVSHFQSESETACPVRAGVNIFLLIREHRCLGDTTVSGYSTAQGIRSVIALDIITVLRFETIRVGAARLQKMSERTLSALTEP